MGGGILFTTASPKAPGMRRVRGGNREQMGQGLAGTAGPGLLETGGGAPPQMPLAPAGPEGNDFHLPSQQRCPKAAD